MLVLNQILAAGESAGRALPLLRSLEAALGQPHAGTILRVLAVLALGAAGVYLMLPRGQRAGKRFERYLGGALATLSLVLMITTAVSAGVSGLEGTKSIIIWSLDDQPSPTSYIFHVLAAVSLAAAVMMITSRNPVYSALWFALVLLGNSGLFLLQKAEFLSAATVIVYAGAIVVTFLFVIMLAQPAGAARYDRYSREPLLVTATGLVLASVLVGTLHYSARFEKWGPDTAASFRPSEDTIAKVTEKVSENARIEGPHVAGLGKSLFVDHVASVEVIGVLLLAAV
ncbi:MAG TPA: NADH-quinone oxidoreductase subunit J, partial [Planctomycetaceae bacterium]|nr:NADH-quinone oxidoreductase subunit J [Planctomycetaceae bacterium]